MKTCKICVLPETFPGIKFNPQGICIYCQEFKGREDLEKSQAKYKARFEELLEKYQGKGSYDGLMAFSGGKDSSYTLAILREEYDLRILALTFDNGFIPDITFKNIRNVCEKLEVDHLLFKPKFSLLKKIFLRGMQSDMYSPKTLERASTICTSCMGLVKFFSLRLSLEKEIPFITYGWSPGQAPISASIFKNNATMLESMQKALKQPLAEIGGKEIDPYFLEQRHFALKDKFPYNISPLAFLEYDEEKIFAKMEKLGWVKPQVTDSNSTNCLLNSFANIVHKTQFNFHPYAFELAKLVREGYMKREEALERLSQPEDEQTVRMVKEKLGIK
jgi:tRNA(Ile)-lysidine synthase TilS/MesJ